jgi:photosystem II stability/assembly factor-like uncharacterized protein
MRRSLIAAVPLIAGVPLAGCGSSSAPTATNAAGGITIPAEAGHVHGFASTRAGGIVIGTHGGLYALARGGALEPVGEPADYMGLAALPSGVLLSSGHPAPGSDEPNPLGLRRSSDGGASWTRIDAVPRDDYHVIESGGGRVYAVGSDGAVYAGAAPTAMAAVGMAPAGLIDLAVHPAQAGTLIAATQSGLSRSGDSGRTWTPVGDVLGLLSWASPDALFMVDEQGQVSVSSDGAQSWSPRGTIGAPPAALLASSPSDLVAADHDGRIRSSADGGRTWS